MSDTAPPPATDSSTSSDSLTLLIQSSVPAKSTAPPSSSSTSTSPASKGKLPITVTPSSTILEVKTLIASSLEAPVEQQRLIHGGKVLKNEQTVGSYNLKEGHTVHMVKSAPPTTAPATNQPLPTLQTGQQFTNNPLAPLMNATNQIAPMDNAFAQMGVNPNDLNMNAALMNSPEVRAQMSRMMEDPAFVEQLIQASPQLRNLPGAADMIRSPFFRSMLTNPQIMQQVQQMRNAMQGGGPGGGPSSGPSAAEAPGNLFAQAQAGAPGAGAAPGGMPDFSGLMQAMGGGQQAAAGQGQGQGGMGGLDIQQQMQQFQQMMQNMQQGGGGGGFGGFGGMGPFGGGFGGQQQQPQQPGDSRPPEERFQSQLASLQEMGFFDAQQNIRALQATNGNVHAAVEYILGGGAAGGGQ